MSTQISAPKNQVINYQNQPVLTTAQLAGFFGVDCNNIQQNFKRNLSRFVEGKHFFKLTGADLKNFKQLTDSKTVSRNTKNLILWTERGAARHAKMLDTDHAWEVFEQLEDSYFNQVKKPQTESVPYVPSGNEVFLPKAQGKYFIENKKDGTLIVRDANKVTVIRRSDLEVVKRDCQTIRQELELFSRQLERMEKSLEVDEDLLPILGRLNWRGV